jgi:hypothetical protein
MSEPVSKTFTQEQLQRQAKEFLTELYGKPGDGNDADKWHEKFGLLYCFVSELFEDK